MSEALTKKYVVLKPCVVGDDDDVPDPHTIWLVVGNQSFQLHDYRNSKEEAEWMASMLGKALATLVEQETLAGGHGAAANP